MKHDTILSLFSLSLGTLKVGVQILDQWMQSWELTCDMMDLFLEA